MKQNYDITVRLSDELARKLIYICEAEGRTPNNQFIFMLRNNIQYFERTKGKPDPAKLRNIDLSEYFSESNAEQRQAEKASPVPTESTVKCTRENTDKNTDGATGDIK